MEHLARLLIDCPRRERCGVLALNDDRTIACPLCNSWCSLCLDGVPTFIPITRPYRGSLIAGMRPTIDGERLFEGYACDYHKAALRDYETFTIIVRADKAIRIERSRTFWYNGSLRRTAGVRGHGAGALFGRAVRGGRAGERRLADEGVAVILRDRAAAAGVDPFRPHDMLIASEKGHGTIPSPARG